MRARQSGQAMVDMAVMLGVVVMRFLGIIYPGKFHNIQASGDGSFIEMIVGGMGGGGSRSRVTQPPGRCTRSRQGHGHSSFTMKQ